MYEKKFGVFIRDGRGVLWRYFCDDLEEAERRAKEIATTEGVESIVFNLRNFLEVATFSWEMATGRITRQYPCHPDPNPNVAPPEISASWPSVEARSRAKSA